ncbi:MAG: hypothetical protein JJE39_08695 [Vicinamibacteria bacterium]|nr:hypothetical protein [Vicinamibacteria bacterium]
MRAGREIGGEGPLIHRLELREMYRCLECNSSFFRFNLTRLIAFSLLIFFVLGGLSYAAMRMAGSSGGSKPSPRIKRVPPAPPPAFR